MEKFTQRKYVKKSKSNFYNVSLNKRSKTTQVLACEHLVLCIGFLKRDTPVWSKWAYWCSISKETRTRDIKGNRIQKQNQERNINDNGLMFYRHQVKCTHAWILSKIPWEIFKETFLCLQNIFPLKTCVNLNVFPYS